MARIRTIKPEFFSSEDIVSMTPLARLFYVSMWCEADRAGRLEWKPGTFKMRYFPGDNCSIPKLADELIERGLIVLYEANGKTFAEIPTFAEHQVINNRESESLIPARVSTPLSRVKAEGKEGRKEGREGKGKEGTSFADFAGEDENEVTNRIPMTDAERELQVHLSLVHPEKPKAQPKATAEFDLPDWINRAHWDAWHSCPKRKKATPEQKQLSVDKLSAWRDQHLDYAGALENAAVGGYQGLFLPDPGRSGSFPARPNASQTQADRRAQTIAELTGRNRLATTGDPHGNQPSIVDVQAHRIA